MCSSDLFPSHDRRNCGVMAIKTLNVSIAGTGSVEYKGNPTVTKSIAGIGSVKKRGE